MGGLGRQQPLRRRVAQHPPEQHPGTARAGRDRPARRAPARASSRSRGGPTRRVRRSHRRPAPPSRRAGGRARRCRCRSPARSNSFASIRPGCSAVSPPTSAQPAWRQPSATPATSSATLRGLEAADRHVVEERERLGAAAHDVVRAHRDEVLADRVVPAQRPGDRRLRAHAIGRGHDHRLPEPGRDRDRGAEPAEAAQDLGAMRRRDRGAHQLDRALTGIDVDAGARVRRPSAHDA